ncbi:MAG TPA: hypothetical protein VFV58_23045 [Blastocatellia bacterium]|nr:hypothetical protein [Blastocatellia bacterium]
MKRNESLLSMAPIFLTLVACSSGTKPALNQSPTPALAAAPKIGIIRDPKFRDECGVYLQLPEDNKSQNGKYIFTRDLGEIGQMNMDGHDVDLKLVDSDEPDRELKVGDHFSETYAGDGLKARIDYVVTGVCDPKDEACEVINIDATVIVERNGSKRQIKTSGLLGC